MLVEALSVVHPWGEAIAAGRKTIEVRAWAPPRWPIDRLLIVENDRRLVAGDEPDPAGRAVAIVRVAEVRPWTPADADAACSPYEPGWLAWVLTDVRAIGKPFTARAARRIYTLELDPTRLVDTVGALIDI
jgi:hypothetical protein